MAAMACWRTAIACGSRCADEVGCCELRRGEEARIRTNERTKRSTRMGHPRRSPRTVPTKPAMRCDWDLPPKGWREDGAGAGKRRMKRERRERAKRAGRMSTSEGELRTMGLWQSSIGKPIGTNLQKTPMMCRMRQFQKGSRTYRAGPSLRSE